jgi:penicillin-binding protein 2
MIREPKDHNPKWRIYLMTVFVFLGLLVLLISLANRQILQGNYWSDQMAQSSTRTVKMPAPRGKILDRNGIILVGNRPSYNVALYLDEFGISRTRQKQLIKAVQASVEELKKRMKMPVNVDEKVVQVHYNLRGPLPLTVWNDLSPAALAAFEERSPWMKGVDLQIEPVRVYPFGNLASHLLGYVGKPESSKQTQEMYDSEGRRAFSQPAVIGKAGIEAALEPQLKGRPGERIIRLNAAGFKESEVKNEDPTPGKNVILTIDQEIQNIVEETFVNYRGACIVLDPRNGDVLAIASFPSYNPNTFIPAIKKADWQNLIRDGQKPLINRAIQGTYHPGSTFKVITALAGLEAGMINENTNVECLGHYNLGPIEFKCWQTGGHGDVHLKEAIQMSCNVFFYTIGRNLGGPAMWNMSKAFGLGQRTGIPLDHESKGLLPTEDWKRINQPAELARWTPGDSVNMAIGQGYLEVTPLQMAGVVAAIANGGTVYKPRLVDHIETYEGDLVQKFEPEVVSKIPVTAHNLAILKDGMLSVVQDNGGTGHSAKQAKIKIAGKTGSAQSPTRDPQTGEMVKQTTTWMISFAPFEEPRYAISIVAEAGDSGGHTCGPFTGTIYKKIFDLEETRKNPRPPTSVVALPVSEKMTGSEGDVSGELLGVDNNTSNMTPPTDQDDDDSPPPAAYPAEKVNLP